MRGSHLKPAAGTQVIQARNGMHHPSQDSLGVDSALGSQLHLGTLDGGQSLEQVDIFSHLNNRALSHEMQLNQIQRELKLQSQKIKLEKYKLREVREKLKKEQKAREQKE